VSSATAIDGTATGGGPTRATRVVAVIRVYVVTDDLFTGLDVSQGKEDEMTADDLQKAVGFARVIDVLRRIATHTAVNTPVSVQTTDIDTVLTSDSPDDFIAGYALANIFGNLASFAEANRGEASLTIDSRFANSDSGR
jgi:hypothetical protein